MTAAFLRQLKRPTRFANHHSRLARGNSNLPVCKMWRLAIIWLAGGEATVIRFSGRPLTRVGDGGAFKISRELTDVVNGDMSAHGFRTSARDDFSFKPANQPYLALPKDVPNLRGCGTASEQKKLLPVLRLAEVRKNRARLGGLAETSIGRRSLVLITRHRIAGCK